MLRDEEPILDLRTYKIWEDKGVVDTSMLGRIFHKTGTIPPSAYNSSMNDNVREVFDAKLEAIEARMDARVATVASKLDAFLATQTAVQNEREKAQLERDKRLEMLAERAARAAEGAEEAAKQAATVKANYWAAVVVQLLAVVAILVGAYYANQANVFGAMQTTLTAMTAAKELPKEHAVDKSPK